MISKPSYDNTLLLIRGEREGQRGTFGVLEHKGKHLCFTLEPFDCSGARFKGLLPATYALLSSYSTRFRMYTPELIVSGRSGIRIHVGNFASQTKGCILVGLDYDAKGLLGSTAAFKMLTNYIRTNNIKYITITDYPTDERLYKTPY